MAKPSLGLDIEWKGAQAEWMLVKAVEPGGLADAGGIQAGDTVLKMADKAPVDFIRDDFPVGPVRVVIERDGQNIARYLEIPKPAPVPSPADPFAGVFENPSYNRQAAETELVSVAPGCEHLLYGAMLPNKRPADKAAIAKLRAELQAPDNAPLQKPKPAPFQAFSETEPVFPFDQPKRRRIVNF